jgi:hypothetical protein
MSLLVMRLGALWLQFVLMLRQTDYRNRARLCLVIVEFSPWKNSSVVARRTGSSSGGLCYDLARGVAVVGGLNVGAAEAVIGSDDGVALQVAGRVTFTG